MLKITKSKPRAHKEASDMQCLDTTSTSHLLHRPSPQTQPFSPTAIKQQRISQCLLIHLQPFPIHHPNEYDFLNPKLSGEAKCACHDRQDHTVKTRMGGNSAPVKCDTKTKYAQKSKKANSIKVRPQAPRTPSNTNFMEATIAIARNQERSKTS